MLKKLTILICLVALVGCPDDAELGETEAAAINTIFKTGVTFERDPFVRAETFRVIELIGDPALGEYAAEGLDDGSPMVRVASLRAALASGVSDAPSMATRIFANGTPAEQRAILNAVAQYEEGPSRRELLGRALRSNDPELRRIAFQANFLDRIDEALAAKDTKLLERTLYPELGRYVRLDADPTLAALAAEKFVEIGQNERLEPLLDALSDPEEDLETRLEAARILTDAHAKPARKHFNAIIRRYHELLADDTLGVPGEVVPPKLLRAATLGSVASGDTTYVKEAQAYANKAPAPETIEVLEALAANPSEDAAITLKVAMQDARRPVRLTAIKLYREKEDADPRALINALKGADGETQERIAALLKERFRDDWITALRSQLQRTSTVDHSLELLRNVVKDAEDAQALIVPLKDVLQKVVAKEEKEERAALAAYLLAIISDDPAAAKSAVAKLDAPTRYAYLEFLVRTQPDEHLGTFRKYLYDDMYVMRLMSAAGLWRVLGISAQDAAKEGQGESETEAEAAEGGADEES